MRKTKETNKEYETFSDALEKVLRISHSELKARVEQAKKQRAKRKRRS
jgi:hypothetical protein